MDTITHGIAGALFGKAFFAQAIPGGASAPEQAAVSLRNRAAIGAATLGAVFPDSDSILGVFDSSGLAVISTHRAETHSFLLLPAWAAGLAALTLALCRWRKWTAPPFRAMFAFWAAGIALHIVFDLITSFGTMIWSPLNYSRPAWDLAFILDFTLTGIVLLPQLAAWVFRRREGSAWRGVAMLLLCGAAAWLLQRFAHANQVQFTDTALAIALLTLAAVFFAPQAGGAGFGLSRAAWCRAGVALVVMYLGACWMANRAAVERVATYARAQGLAVERIGAMPMPAWMGQWLGLIRTPQGVHVALFSLQDEGAPQFEFVADTASGAELAAVRSLPEVQTYLRFARFPTIQSSRADGQQIVELRDHRFAGRRRAGAAPFTYRIVLDERGRVLSQGWAP